MIPLIVIRPQPGCDHTVAAALAQGFDAQECPLFAVSPLAWEPALPGNFDALLIGSANVLRHGGKELAAYAGMPAYVVGEATALAARRAGLDVVATGVGGLQTMLGQLQPAHRRLLRLAGRERVVLSAPAEVTIAECVVYASDPLPMTAAMADALRHPAVVLLHSAEAARHFAAECDRLGLDRSTVTLAALGPRIARAAGSGWAALECAERPEDHALLVLAANMCQTQDKEQVADGMTMQDETYTQAPPPRRTGRTLLFATLLAFVLGGGLTVWLAQDGTLDFLLPREHKVDASLAMPDNDLVPAPGETGAAPLQAEPLPLTSNVLAQTASGMGGVETRLALLEERLARLDVQADSASGNAARAEALLVAFAARRVIAKGAQLGYLEDQLKLRFGGAQPEAVRTLTDFARKPVTLDQLVGGLDALAPGLGQAPSSEGLWSQVKREFGSLFVVRPAGTQVQTPQGHVERAHLLLAAGKTADAIAEVSRLPGADGAKAWIDGARRFDAAQQALDLIETSAMLEQRGLQDAQGSRVSQPSPLAAPPAPKASPVPAPAPSPSSTGPAQGI